MSSSSTEVVFKNIAQDGFLGSFKSVRSDLAKIEEGDTRNTSQEYDKFEVPQIEVDELKVSKVQNNQFHQDKRGDDHSILGSVNNSFMYADIDLGEKKESFKNEEPVSEKISTRLFKTFTSIKKYVRGDKPYGCSCPRAKNPDLDWCQKAEEWLKFAFLGSQKAFSQKGTNLNNLWF